MHPRMRRAALFVAASMLVGMVAVPAFAEHGDRERTKNLHPKGHIEEPRSLLNEDVGNTNIHTDIAFWGRLAFQGNWDGFTIRDISNPDDPQTVSHTSCDGNQGDIVVWDDVLVRSWNAPAGEGAPPFGAGTTCAGETVPDGFEGVHIFNIGDPANPVLVGSVETDCGSHTATGVPDLANDRLLVYNTPSSGDCPGIDIIEVPLNAPENAAFLRFEDAGRPCHDTGVILGDAMMAACAGGNGYTVWTLDPADLTDPQFLLSKDVNEEEEIDGVTIGHSAGFSWDGEVLVFGHEPGGGVVPRCREEDPDSDKSAMFFETTTGEFLGMWTLPRPQGDDENCTIHNYNVVPLRSERDVLVVGNYQAGTWVVDFTDPTDPQTVAWSDPEAKPVPEEGLGAALGTDVCGAWSSYWYNNFIYETNICEGLNIFRLSGNETAGAMRLGHLNPQTQEFTIP